MWTRKLLKMTPTKLRWLMNVWPPFLFAGIRVLAISDDWCHAKVRLHRHLLNQNIFGVHFGGSLYAMVNPFWPLLVLGKLGKGYIVWDTAGEIEFIKAVREDVYAEFQLDPAVVEEMRDAAAGGDKVLRWFDTDIKTAKGEVIATVRKQVYVRQKPKESTDTGISHE